MQQLVSGGLLASRGAIIASHTQKPSQLCDLRHAGCTDPHQALASRRGRIRSQLGFASHAAAAAAALTALSALKARRARSLQPDAFAEGTLVEVLSSTYDGWLRGEVDGTSPTGMTKVNVMGTVGEYIPSQIRIAPPLIPTSCLEVGQKVVGTVVGWNVEGLRVDVGAEAIAKIHPSGMYKGDRPQLVAGDIVKAWSQDNGRWHLAVVKERNASGVVVTFEAEGRHGPSRKVWHNRLSLVCPAGLAKSACRRITCFVRQEARPGELHLSICPEKALTPYQDVRGLVRHCRAGTKLIAIVTWVESRRIFVEAKLPGSGLHLVDGIVRTKPGDESIALVGQVVKVVVSKVSPWTASVEFRLC